MKKTLITRPVALSAGILLVIPTLYFVVSAWLNYAVGFSTLWRIIEPIFEKAENKTLGLNLNLLISCGPVLAILINLPQVLHIRLQNAEDELHAHVVAKKYGWNWIVISAATLCLAALGMYLVGENCRG